MRSRFLHVVVTFPGGAVRVYSLERYSLLPVEALEGTKARFVRGAVRR